MAEIASPAVVETQGLGRRYGRRWALAHLDLCVKGGECLLVVGANGSGKTTLLRILATGLLPSTGSLRLFGEPATTAAGAVRVRPRIALLSHQLGLYEDLSAAQNLEILAGLGGRPALVDAWLDEVGLERRPDPVRTYSAGMRKRLGFARLLAQSPRLALIDEPYGQLDPEGFRTTEILMERLRTQGVTLIVASHLVERASRWADRALLLDQGMPRWTGPARDISSAWTQLHTGTRKTSAARPS